MLWWYRLYWYHPKSTTKTPAIAGWVLDGPAIAGDQGFKGSKKEGPGHFMVNFGGGL